jgi:hypothetical protein
VNQQATSVSTQSAGRGALKLTAEFFGAVMRAWFGGQPASPSSSPSVEAARVDGTRFGRGVKTLAALSLIAFGAALVSYVFMTRLMENAGANAQSLIQTGTVGLTVATLITALKDLMLVAENLWTYIRAGTAKSNLAEYTKFAATALAVSASCFSFALKPPDDKAKDLGSLPAELSRPTLLVAASSMESGFHFPFLFELADGPPSWKKGVELTAIHRPDLEKLANTLNACVGAGRDVVVRVTGFADANDFKQTSGNQTASMELNREAANRRATALHAELKRALSPKGQSPSAVVLEPVVQWDSGRLADMLRSPRYLNAKPLTETNDRDQGRFNRRAEITLVNAGVCERLEIKTAGR